MLNRVDPLFFFLAAQQQHLERQPSTSDTNPKTHKKSKSTWQPLEQCFEEVSSCFPREIHSTIPMDQLKHVCLTFVNDDVCYFKFDVKKSLHWLQRKHQQLFQHLLHQDQRKQQTYKEANGVLPVGTNHRDESMSENFYMPESEPSSTVAATPVSNKTPTERDSNNHSSPDVFLSDTEALKVDSVQIICNYLTEPWAAKFIEHLGLSAEQVFGTKTGTNKPSSTTTNTTGGSNNNDTQTMFCNIRRVVETDNNGSTTAASSSNKATTSAIESSSARTAGNKRLSKINTKGTPSISSFFGGGIQTKKPKHQ
jgi:hypothetical protein